MSHLNLTHRAVAAMEMGVHDQLDVVCGEAKQTQLRIRVVLQLHDGSGGVREGDPQVPSGSAITSVSLPVSMSTYPRVVSTRNSGE